MLFVKLQSQNVIGADGSFPATDVLTTVVASPSHTGLSSK